MVANSQTALRCQKAFYLAALILVQGACSNPSSVLILETHHKPAEELARIIPFVLQEDIEYKISGNQIVLLGDSERYQLALSTLKSLDQPPKSYTLWLEDIKGKRYSTSNEPTKIHLIEGRLTKTEIKGVKLQIRVQLAGENTSLLETKAEVRSEEKHINHWHIQHNQWLQPDKRIFPNGIKLEIDRQ